MESRNRAQEVQEGSVPIREKSTFKIKEIKKPGIMKKWQQFKVIKEASVRDLRDKQGHSMT